MGCPAGTQQFVCPDEEATALWREPTVKLQ